MQIKNVEEATVFFVQTDEPYPNQYTRYDPYNWTVSIGESDEPVYDCQELEDLFQQYLKSNTNI